MEEGRIARLTGDVHRRERMAPSAVSMRSLETVRQDRKIERQEDRKPRSAGGRTWPLATCVGDQLISVDRSHPPPSTHLLSLSLALGQTALGEIAIELLELSVVIEFSIQRQG